MKKYTFACPMFILFLVLLGFSANLAGAANCAPEELFDTVTGKRCSNVTTVIGCAPGHLFSALTGQSCGNSSQDNSSLPLLKFNDLLKSNFKVGLKSENVKPLQQLLKDRGYYFGKIDGKYGKITDRAVKDFKDDNGLDVIQVATPSFTISPVAINPANIYPTTVPSIPTTITQTTQSDSKSSLSFPITILSPKERETYKAGDVMNITWEVNKKVGHNDTFIVSVNTQWHTDINSKYYGDMFLSPLLPYNVRSYSWKIPDPVPPHDPYPFRINVGLCESPIDGKPIPVDGGYQSCANTYSDSVFYVNIIQSQVVSNPQTITTNTGSNQIVPAEIKITQNTSGSYGQISNSIKKQIIVTSSASIPQYRQVPISSVNTTDNVSFGNFTLKSEGMDSTLNSLKLTFNYTGGLSLPVILAKMQLKVGDTIYSANPTGTGDTFSDLNISLPKDSIIPITFIGQVNPDTSGHIWHSTFTVSFLANDSSVVALDSSGNKMPVKEAVIWGDYVNFSK